MKSKHPSHIQAVLIVLAVFFGLVFINNPALTGKATYAEELSTFQSARINLVNYQREFPELFSIMGWNVNEATLKSYETKLNNITTSTKSESIQRSEIEQLYQEWQTLTDPLPKHARLERKFVDTFIAEPADVQPYTMNGNDVYFSQQNYNIVMTVTVYDVDLYSDISKKISVITTTITPKQNTGQVDIVQEVPKEIPHASIKNKTPGITSKGNTYTSTFSNLNNPVTLTYAVEGVSITAEELFNYKTIILTSQPQTEQNTSGTEIKDYECGDSVCQTPFEDGITCPEDCAQQKNQYPG